LNFSPLFSSFVLSVAAFGCAPKPQPIEQKSFSFRVTGDPGKPVRGAELVANGQVLATTDALGVAPLTLSGHEGDTFEIAVKCPPEFQSPQRPTKIAIRRLAGTNTVLEYGASCQPKARSIVLAVNGMKGIRLPIMQLGRTIGETDENGVATILLHVEPNDQFEVSLDTSAPENSFLRPRNPAATFIAKNEDDVFIFDPGLTQLPKPRPIVSVRRHVVPINDGPPIPIRIQ
jgi:hypothetical protein